MQSPTRLAVLSCLAAGIATGNTPPSLQWATLFGGSGNETAQHLAADPSGAVYIAGRTTSADLLGCRVLDGPWNRPSFMLWADAFVAKISSDGRRLEWCTYLGGAGAEDVYGLALDGRRRVHVLGRTSSFLFPVTPEAMQTVLTGESDAFLTTLDPDSGDILSSTLLGVPGLLATYSPKLHLAVDDEGSAWIAGTAFIKNLSTTLGALQRTAGSGYIMRINSARTAAVYQTYFGGPGDVRISAIAVDARGSLLVAGTTSQTAGFPLVNPLPVPEQQGFTLPFVSRLNPGGSALEFSTHLVGLRRSLEVAAVAIDARGAIWVAGDTGDEQFSVVNPIAVDRALSPAGYQNRAFLVRLAPDATSVETITDLATAGVNSVSALRIAEGTAACLLATLAPNAPLTPGASLLRDNQPNSALVCTDAEGKRLETIAPLDLKAASALGLAFSSGGEVFVGGTGSDGTATPGAFQTEYKGGHQECSTCYDRTDGMVARFMRAATVPVIDSVIPSVLVIPWSQDHVREVEFTLYGPGFPADSTVLWDGRPITPKVTARNQIFFTVPKADLVPGRAGIRVSSGGRISEERSIDLANPYPVAAYVVPASAQAGSDDVKVAVYGELTPQSKILWNGADRQATLNGTHFEFIVTAAELKNAGINEVRISNPGPGGGVSAPSYFSVAPAQGTTGVPWLSAAPLRVNLPHDGKPLRVTGGGFTSATKVLWNGEPRETTFVSDTALDFSPQPKDIARWGVAQVQVSGSAGSSGRKPAYIGARFAAVATAWDGRNRLVYAVAHRYPPGATDIAVINPVAGTVEVIGTLPDVYHGIALSEDGAYLWTYRAYGEPATVRRMDLRSRSFDLELKVRHGGAESSVAAAAAIPGSPRSIAVMDSSGWIAIYDDAVRRPYTLKLRGGIYLQPGFMAVTSDRLYSTYPWLVCAEYVTWDGYGLGTLFPCNRENGPNSLVRSERGLHWFPDNGRVRVVGYDRVPTDTSRGQDQNAYAADLERRRVWTIDWISSVAYLLAFDLDSGEMIDLRAVPARYPARLEWLPELDRLMSVTGDAIYFIPR